MHLDPYHPIGSHISFDQVTLSRQDKVVLNKINLTLTERRIGLIGNNGSGKSSLVRLMNGLLKPESGKILVNGIDPSVGPHKMAAHIGFIFQNPDHQIIFPTVQEELCFGLLNQGVPKPIALNRVKQLLNEHQRGDWAERAIHSLSDGQKQLVCILAVLIMQPSVLILDEPFSALDLVTRYQLLSLLEQLPQQIVMISHELETLQTFDRVIWLAEGQIHRDGAPEAVLAEYTAQAKRFRR